MPPFIFKVVAFATLSSAIPVILQPRVPAAAVTGGTISLRTLWPDASMRFPLVTVTKVATVVRSQGSETSNYQDLENITRTRLWSSQPMTQFSESTERPHLLEKGQRYDRSVLQTRPGRGGSLDGLSSLLDPFGFFRPRPSSSAQGGLGGDAYQQPANPWAPAPTQTPQGIWNDAAPVPQWNPAPYNPTPTPFLGENNGLPQASWSPKPNTNTGWTPVVTEAPFTPQPEPQTDVGPGWSKTMDGNNIIFTNTELNQLPTGTPSDTSGYAQPAQQQPFNQGGQNSNQNQDTGYSVYQWGENGYYPVGPAPNPYANGEGGLGGGNGLYPNSAPSRSDGILAGGDSKGSGFSNGFSKNEDSNDRDSSDQNSDDRDSDNKDSDDRESNSENSNAQESGGDAGDRDSGGESNDEDSGADSNDGDSGGDSDGERRKHVRLRRGRVKMYDFSRS